MRSRHARVLRPLMFMAHEPQIPSRQERLTQHVAEMIRSLANRLLFLLRLSLPQEGMEQGGGNA